MWALIIEIKQQLEKTEKKAKLCNTGFLSKKINFQKNESH